MSPVRGRGHTALCLTATILAGLASRRFPLPGFLAEHAGDALYTVAAFFVFAWIAPARRASVLAGAALLFSGLVELSQLLPWHWLVRLRHDPVGALFLGQGFQWADFLAYGAGAVVAMGLDRCWLRPG